MLMNPKSVLMIAYYFPPEGSAAVYRSLRFLKELVKNGWQAFVVACEPYQYERTDQQLLEQVPLTARVVRVKHRDLWHAFQVWYGRRGRGKGTVPGSPVEATRQTVAGDRLSWRGRIHRVVKLVEACVYRPDKFMRWIRPATQEAIAICRQDRPSVVWATIGPLSAGVVAYRTWQTTGIPYVLDFRDPWGLDYYPREAMRPTWAREVDNRIISQMFEGAQAVVFMFESVAQAYLRAFPALEKAKIHIIPNGFDGEVESFTHAPGDCCTVLYAGTLSTYRYDTLLEGLRRLKGRDHTRAALLRVRFIGEGFGDLSARVAALDIYDLVEILPPTTNAEIRRLQREAHALLILGRMAGRKGHELVAGAKLFGYLQAGRPIIGIVPHDETRKILQQVGSSLIAEADAPEEIADMFEVLLKAWSNRRLDRFVPNRAACEAYSSSSQLSALIAALNGKPREHR